MAGSPFFLKNFMHTLGHFDIYGCALAICLLLMPARSIVFVLLAALASMILILIHHIHLLMYVPTIAVIVVLRYYLVQGFDRRNIAVGIAAAAVRRTVVLRRAIPGNDGGARGGVRPLSAKPDGRSQPNRSPELQLHLVSAAFQGNLRYLGAHALQHSGRAGVRAADLAAYPAVEIFCRPDPRAVE